MSDHDISQPITIGCAGWTIAREHSELFPSEGTHLERYATLFSAVEINTTFYRLHRPATFRKWAGAVPEHFRFAVKAPRTMTHYGRLRDMTDLEPFLEGVSQLGDKLGPILVQLPPSLAFDAAVADTFFTTFRQQYDGSLVCEPRHASWFTPEGTQLLVDHEVARVAADPVRAAGAGQAGGWPGLVYYRLHGSPRIYYSAYSTEYLDALAAELEVYAGEVPVWCFFDNTAGGEAVGNALYLKSRLTEK